MIFKYLCGIFALLSVISARPSSENFGDRVRRALTENGINYNDTTKFEASKSAGNKMWSNCGTERDLGTIKTVEIKPNPPQKGKDLNLETTIMLSEEIKGGSLQVKIHYIIYGISIAVADNSYDLCDPELGLVCPLKAGQVKINFKQDIHALTPSGIYTGLIVARRGDDQLICFKLEFSL